jgi:nicotinate-nucleotide adenylyltransferase
MKKIGFFGGTFDPLHFGHLSLAVRLAELHGLDEVLFCPVNQSPFKKRVPSALPEHRMAMIELGIQGMPLFKLCKLELERGGVSYTVDSLRWLKEHYEKKNEPVELYLLLSSESIPSFHQWKEAEEIVQLARPIIGNRGESIQKIPNSPFQETLLSSMISTPIMEISSTEIRERLSKELYCSHLVPAIILDYIRRHNLY